MVLSALKASLPFIGATSYYLKLNLPRAENTNGDYHRIIVIRGKSWIKEFFNVPINAD